MAHWAQVRVNGLALVAQTGANPRVVELFAFVHDCERHSEGDDPLHGARAARHIRALRPWLSGLMQATSIGTLDSRQVPSGELIEGVNRIDASRSTPILTTLRAASAPALGKSAATAEALQSVAGKN